MARRLELAAGKGVRLRKARRNAFTAAKKEKFFAALAATCNVEAACRAARVSSSTVYAHRRKDAGFRARWAETVREAYGKLELMFLERMMNGTVKTVTKADGSVETIHEYPNAIALQLLRLHKDEAIEAAVEHDPAEVEGLRERILQKLEKMSQRMGTEGGNGEA